MLSIIVSSYQEKYFNQFSNSVKETIGVNFDYEIVQIWNPGIMSICEAYNKGVDKSRYDNLLFVHEDIVFQTNDWGKILLDFINKLNIGCIGLAGSDYVANCPSGWHIDKRYMFRNIIQFNNKKQDFEIKKSETKKVYSLDGVFIGISKLKYEQFKFNQKLKGFHGYDIDFSIRVSEKYDNYVISNINIIHYSSGGFSKDLVKARIIARNNYKIPNNQINDKVIENKALSIFMNDMVKSKFTNKEILINFLPYINPYKIGFRGALYNLKKFINLIIE